MEQIIYLEPTDDLPAIRDRLEWAESDRVLLVLPKGYRPLQSPVGLRLLLRHAAAQEKQIALVTRDRVTVELAREQGVVVYPSVERGQRGKLTKAELAEAPVRRGGRAAPVPAGERPAAFEPVKSSAGRWSQMGIVFILVAVAGLMLLGVALVVLPAADVTVTLPGVALSETRTIQADATLEETLPITSAIPARDVRVEVKGNVLVNVTTQKDMPDAKATGEVQLTNRTDAEIIVPPGMVLLTSTGVTVRFQTVETATVPAGVGAKVTTKIEAVEPGLGGNVRAFVINRMEGVEALRVTVINETATSGGTVKSVPVVGNEDRARARALLLQRLQQEAYAKLQDELREQEFLPVETMVAIPISEVYDKFADEAAAELGLDMIIVVKALAVSGTDANALALDMLQRKVPQGMELLPRTLKFQTGEIIEVRDRLVVFKMGVSGTAAPVVDRAGIIDAIRGKSVRDAKEIITQALCLESQPEIVLRNSWLGRLPFLAMRINLKTLAPGEQP